MAYWREPHNDYLMGYVKIVRNYSTPFVLWIVNVNKWYTRDDLRIILFIINESDLLDVELGFDMRGGDYDV